MNKYLKLIPALVVVFIVAWAVYATVRMQQAYKQITDPGVPDTVYLTRASIDTVIEKARDPKVTFVDRVLTKEVKPDTVFIATGAPRPLDELPKWGMQEVVKDGDRLEVVSLSRNGSEMQRNVYTLPNPSADYTLVSGKDAANLRTGRGWKLLHLEGEVTVMAGTGGFAAWAEGPISVSPIPNLSVKPTALVTPEGESLGASATYRF